MDPGEVLEVILDSGEPKENVPPDLEEEGHVILSMEPRDEQWRILVKRGDD